MCWTTLIDAIISYLQYDGRMPFTRIAAELNVNEGTIRKRVNKLTADGIMQIVAVVPPHELGWTEAAMIGVQVQASMLTSVADQLARLPEVTYLFQAAGGFDFFVEVYCRDRDHFVSFLNDHLQKITGVERTQSFLILKMYKLSYRWGEANPPQIDGQPSELPSP